MSTRLAVFISSIFCGISIVYTTFTMLQKENKKSKKKIILSILLISIITYYSYTINYNAEGTIFKILLYIIALKLITGESVYKTIVTIIITILLLSIGDIASNIIFVNIASIDKIRSIWYYILLSNLLVNIITLIIINIPVVKKKLHSFVQQTNDNNIFINIVLIAISAIVIIYIFYNISVNYSWNAKYIINVIIAFSYFLIVIIFLKDKLDYNSLMNKYDTLFDYFKEIEETIDDISLVNHEYKNQLAVIKSLIENGKKKDSLKYIEEIIKEYNIDDKDIISGLKNIPKGGIKGLLYYKIICAKNKKVNIVLDVSPKVKKSLTKLTLNENKILSKALGIYIDNAIDATLETNKKTINVEIYVINNRIHFVITNYFNPKNVDINKISKKGYTVKGRGHGKGLYLINKLLNKEKWISHENNIINSCYVQKISIEKSQDK